MPTRSAISMAEAAVLHFASVAKSRNAVLPATPPVTDPLKTTVTKIKIHMTSLQLTELAIFPTIALESNRRNRALFLLPET